MNAPRVVITGMGAVTPQGYDVGSSWQAVLESRSGIRTITSFDATDFPVTFAAELADGFDGADPKTEIALRAAHEAVASSGLQGGPAVGVFLGSETTRPPLSLLARRVRERQLPSAEEMERAAPWAPTDLLAERFGALGPRSTVSTACTSSAQAVGEATLRIRRGEVQAAITGGVDVLVEPLMMTGFAILGALSSRNQAPDLACRPFDVDRDGFVLADGAALLVLESLDHARARGAPVLGEILGYGCSLNAWRITDSPPDGRGAAQAMEAALRDAGLCADQVDYINAHGTSTVQNDASEARAIQRVFGDHVGQVWVSSTKSMTGHTVAACGSLELIFSLLAVRQAAIPCTRNLEKVDPDCRLRHVMGETHLEKPRIALTNAFGFGGSNASILVGGPP